MVSAPAVKNHIREERLRLNLTQAQLAERAGVNKGTLARAEVLSPSLPTAVRIAAALGKTVEDLFGSR